MKKLLLLSTAVAMIAFIGCQRSKQEQTPQAMIITEGIRFNEGSVPYHDNLLISNFGCEVLNPLNTEGKGYILEIIADKPTPFIAPDGALSGPKGMAIKENYLLIADVNKVVVYNLEDRGAAPQTIPFPEGNLFVNDIVIADSLAYISVTNTGKIFTLNLTNLDNLTSDDLEEYMEVIGANGLVLDDTKLYIASYPADGNTTANNVIYIIEDINNPSLEKLIERPGQYDGLALYNDKLYFTNWVDGEVGFIDLDNNQVTLIEIPEVTFAGPADISILNDTLYIPDLPNSRLVAYPLK